MCWRRGCDEVAPESWEGWAVGSREDHPHHQHSYDLIWCAFYSFIIILTPTSTQAHIDIHREIWNSVTYCCSYRRQRPYRRTCQRYSSTSKRCMAPIGNSSTLSHSSARSARPRIARSAIMIASLAAIRWQMTHHGDGVLRLTNHLCVFILKSLQNHS